MCHISTKRTKTTIIICMMMNVIIRLCRTGVNDYDKVDCNTPFLQWEALNKMRSTFFLLALGFHYFKTLFLLISWIVSKPQCCKESCGLPFVETALFLLKLEKTIEMVLWSKWHRNFLRRKPRMDGNVSFWAVSTWWCVFMVLAQSNSWIAIIINLLNNVRRECTPIWITRL